jgi:hypothetical protein
VGLIRLLLSLLAAVLITLGTAGQLTERSLAASEPFADQMAQSLQNPAVSGEVKSAVQQQAAEAIRSAGAAGGLLGSIAAGLAADGLAAQIAGVVDTPAFADAYRQWAVLLHQGLAAYARDNPVPEVEVEGSRIDVAIAPLLEPIIGANGAGAAAGAIGAIGADAVIIVDTGTDLRILRVLGSLAQWSVWLLAGGGAAILLVVAAGRDRTKWLGIALLTSAAVAAAAGVLVWWLPTASSPQANYPAVGTAVLGALLSGWAAVFAAGAAAGAAVGMLLVAVGRRRPHRTGVAEWPTGQ